MGTAIAEMDILNIQALAEEVVLSMTEYRIQLFEYLKNRMNAIAHRTTQSNHSCGGIGDDW